MSSNEQNNTLYPAPVPKTGQTTSYDDKKRDDGELQKGVAWANQRFTDNQNGTVTDKLTGLIWLKKANAFDQKTWETALSDCNELKDRDHGLTDGSKAGQWRLPNVRELCSLIDYGRDNPALPEDHPFDNVQPFHYWSSSTYSYNTTFGWVVYLYDGSVDDDAKSLDYYVWPVRGGQ